MICRRLQNKRLIARLTCSQLLREARVQQVPQLEPVALGGQVVQEYLLRPGYTKTLPAGCVTCASMYAHTPGEEWEGRGGLWINIVVNVCWPDHRRLADQCRCCCWRRDTGCGRCLHRHTDIQADRQVDRYTQTHKDTHAQTHRHTPSFRLQAFNGYREATRIPTQLIPYHQKREVRNHALHLDA